MTEEQQIEEELRQSEIEEMKEQKRKDNIIQLIDTTKIDNEKLAKDSKTEVTRKLLLGLEDTETKVILVTTNINMYKNISDLDYTVLFNKDIHKLLADINEIIELSQKNQIDIYQEFSYITIFEKSKDNDVVTDFLQHLELNTFNTLWKLKKDYWENQNITDKQKKKIKEVIRNYINNKTYKNTDNSNSNINIRGVYIENNSYLLYRGEEKLPDVLTNFTILPQKELILSETEKILQILIKSNSREVKKDFTMVDFTSPIKFKTALNDIGFVYWGKDKELESIKLLISLNQYPRLKATKTIGLHKINNKWVFVGKDKTINADGTENKDIVYHNTDGIDTNITEVEPITKDELQSIINDLFNYNTLEKTTTILSFVMSCFLKERYKKLNVLMPHLFIIGEAGSGKTETRKAIIEPLLNTTTSASISGVTNFTLIKKGNSSNTIPFLLDEHKPSCMKDYQKKIVSDFLRNVYDGTPSERGRANQTVESYLLTSPVVLLGEEGIQEEAQIHRSIELTFCKEDTKGREKAFLNIKNNSDQLNKLGRLLLNKALLISDDDIKAILNISKINVSKVINNKNIDNRQINSLEVLVAGLMCFCGTVADLGIVLPYKYIELENAIIDNVNNNIDIESKSNVDRTIEIFDRMIGAGAINENDYIMINNNTELALDIKTIYDKFLKYRREHDLKEDCITQLKEFTKQLKKCNYFIAYKPVKIKNTPIDNFDGKKESILKKMYVLDINKMEIRKIDIENFVNQ